MEVPSKRATCGIGVELVGSDDGFYEISRLEPSGAAAKSGLISVGDAVLEIDLVNMQFSTREQMQGALRGPEGSSARIRDTFMGNMSKRAGKLLQDELDLLGPLRLKQVEEARQQIVTLTRELERRREITITRADEADDLVM